ncbi:unnamed protein product [Acanthosepion pharaonis]|uniref:Uncharacterized protein n=1 Tax=Acanthosepion pharaonis TaxID=158019 RepID=A0A812CRQ2_ACAPH|nr:unnamed protein product [Sepia pharaonis]
MATSRKRSINQVSGSIQHHHNPKVKSNVKMMLICFFDVKGILHKEFVPPGQTVNQAFYLEVLKRLREKFSPTICIVSLFHYHFCLSFLSLVSSYSFIISFFSFFISVSFIFFVFSLPFISLSLLFTGALAYSSFFFVYDCFCVIYLSIYLSINIYMEYERRAAVVASFRVGKKPAEVMAWFGFKRTMVMDIWRKWKAFENKDAFTVKQKAHNVRSSAVRTDEFVAAVMETVDNDGSQSYSKIDADMGCHKSMICRTIKKDIGYSSYCKSHRMLITNVFKESRKVKAAILLNEIKQVSTVMLRFFAEKNFIQDQTSNRQNDSSSNSTLNTHTHIYIYSSLFLSIYLSIYLSILFCFLSDSFMISFCLFFFSLSNRN